MKFKKLMLTGAALAMLAVSTISHAGDQAADGKKFNPAVTGAVGRSPVPILVGGMTADTSSRALRLTSSGYIQMTQTNRQSDDNTLVLVYSGPAMLYGTTSWTLTPFVDITKYKAWDVHVSWTDSVGTQASTDSILFELLPVGKHSLTNDGLDYVINLGQSITAGSVDTVSVGWTIGSPRNVAIPVLTNLSKNVFVPIYRTSGAGNGVVANVIFQEVSFPLALRNGAPINENALGFYLRPASAGAYATPAGGSALSFLHNLTIWLVAKAN